MKIYLVAKCEIRYTVIECNMTCEEMIDLEMMDNHKTWFVGYYIEKIFNNKEEAFEFRNHKNNELTKQLRKDFQYE